MSNLYCPACKSSRIVEVSNLHSQWACNACGFQGKADEFEFWDLTEMIDVLNTSCGTGEPLSLEVKQELRFFLEHLQAAEVVIVIERNLQAT